MSSLLLQHDLFIDGQDTPSADGRRFEVRSPHDGAPVASVAAATAADVDRAVAAAQAAFLAWSALTAYERESRIRLISARRATRYEQDKYDRENGA